jgi:hypothetical protein
MDGRLRGWTSAIKTQDKSAVGQGWYWYEVLSTTDPAHIEAAAPGVRRCIGCHVGGHDFVMTQVPLR